MGRATGKRWSGADEARLLAFAAKQHGVLERQQILDAGMSEATLWRRLASKSWSELYPRVYRVLPPPRGAWKQMLMAACLWAGDGAAASHRAAAVLWGVEEEANAPIEISIAHPHNGQERRNVTVHRMDFDPGDTITRVDGIPVTNPSRTLLDLASQRTHDQVDSAMDALIRRRLSSTEQLKGLLRKVAACGRRGLRRFRAVLEERLGIRAKDSDLERLFPKKVIQAHGLPMPVHNHPIWLDGRLFAKVDYAYPELGIFIELHSKKWHLGPERVIHDSQKQNELVLLGATPLIFWWDDVTKSHARTAERIRRAIDMARARLDATTL